MQEHITTVEIYGLLTQLPSAQPGRTEYNRDVVLKLTRDKEKGEKHFIIYSINGKILIKFKVLDTDEDGKFRYQEQETSEKKDKD